MGYVIRQDIIPGLPKIPYRKGISAWEGIVDHSTATPEATDEAESTYFHREWKNREAFPHFAVDWDSITQLADTNYIAWAAGNGNPRYVHIELCETHDHGKFLESYKRYVWLTAEMLRRKNLGVTDGVTLVSHDWVSRHLGGTNHVDPLAYLQSHGVSWSQHIANVQAEYNGAAAQPKPTPVVKAGTVTVMVEALNLRTGPDNGAQVIRQLNKGEQYLFYSIDNGWYNLGGAQWAYGGNGQYLQEHVPTPPQPSTKSIRIVGVTGSAIVMDRPDRNNCNNIGTIAKGTVVSITGSVHGVNSDTGYWEIKYNGRLGYITGKFGVLL
jgi:N-acetylmuramoyl-L-alanine amidase